MEKITKYEAKNMWLHITFVFIKSISKYMATAYAIFSVYYIAYGVFIAHYRVCTSV